MGDRIKIHPATCRSISEFEIALASMPELPPGAQIRYGGDDCVHLASRYGKAPKSLKRGHYFKTTIDGRVVVVKVASAIGSGLYRVARLFRVRIRVPAGRREVAP